jgi:hypothetical protein
LTHSSSSRRRMKSSWRGSLGKRLIPNHSRDRSV